MAKDPDIKRRMNRTEEIIDQLQDNQMPLDEGKELYEEGNELLDEIRESLNEGEGKVMEIE